MSRNILVIDDNKVNRKALKKILQNEYTIYEAINGEEALDFLKKFNDEVSLILLDLIMPIMDGYEFLSIINDDIKLSSIPIIVETSSSDNDIEIKCLSGGASDFITKPYNPEVVKNRVQSIIRLKESVAIINLLEYDRLTNLYTKEFFYQNAAKLIKDNPEKEYDMVCTDIVNFKRLSERYGIKKCDEVLSYLSSEFIKTKRDSSIFGYLGFDKFAFLIEHINYYSNSQLNAYFEKILINCPIPHSVVLKVGVYKKVNKKIQIPSMCDRALVAVEKIKDVYGKSLAIFDDKIQAEITREQEITDSMEDAIVNKEFVVYYQPKWDLQTGEVSGAEALVRWKHPTFGFIPPSDFIPLFERNGFIQKLDYYVWEETLKVIKTWKENGDIIIPISVNVSRADFNSVELVNEINNLVKKYDIEPKYLRLEITETAYSDNPEEIIKDIVELRKLGFKIEMDDFGSGYSSLGMLNELPIDTLKIDRTLIIQEGALTKKSVLGFSLALAKWLGIEALAEGIETVEQADNLRMLGCNKGQGYFFAKPLALEDFEKFLIDQRKRLDNRRNVLDSDIGINSIFNVNINMMLAVNFEQADIDKKDCSLCKKYKIDHIKHPSEVIEYLNVHPQEVEIILFKITENKEECLQVLKDMHNDNELYKIPVIVLFDNIKIPSSLLLKLGVVNIVDLNEEGVFISSYIENVIEIARLRKLELQLLGEKALWKNEAYHDSLTRCYNRRGLYAVVKSMPDEINSAVYIVDVDNLKQYNENFGHEYGDKILKKIVKIIEKEIRDDDVLARFGGDEFIIIMKNLSDEEHAYNKGQELIKIISSNFTEDKLTCSIGIALVDDKDSFNNIFNHLYRITKFENASCTMLNSDEY